MDGSAISSNRLNILKIRGIDKFLLKAVPAVDCSIWKSVN